ncbi:hypothetical protein [Lysobacter silvisoli]|uniref:hypothetical protein n=1 Tax=Lysobacter silvisoli TaxID=2293254 RepID=UPI0011C043AB|nr:hypothetical protein [Lysobacter silvisoli]
MPSVEFIRARPLDTSEYNDGLTNGANPRQLHVEAAGADGRKVLLSLKIEERIWVPRMHLARLIPNGFRLEDSEADITKRAKEAFSAWLARSYVRVELPNDFVELFQKTKLKKFFADIAKKYTHYVQGIYLDIRPQSDASEAIYSPTQVAQFVGPYRLHVTVVVQDPDVMEAIESDLAGLEEERVPVPGGKVSRIAAATAEGMELTTDVVTIDGWTVRDLMGSIRFTDWDHLSTFEESGP